METKKSNLMMLAVLLAVFPMYVLTGCKKKVQSTNAESTEMFNEEQPTLEIPRSEQFPRTDEQISYSLSEDDKGFAEESDEDEEYEEEPDDDSDEPNDEQPDDEEEPDDDDDYYEEEPDDPDEEPNDSWH